MRINLPANYKETINQRIDELEAKIKKISPNIYIERYYEADEFPDDNDFDIYVFYRFRDGREQFLYGIYIHDRRLRITDLEPEYFDDCNAEEESRLQEIISKCKDITWYVVEYDFILSTLNSTLSALNSKRQLIKEKYFA